MKRLFSLLLILASSGSIWQIGLAHPVQRTLFNPGALILEGRVKRLEKHNENSHFFTLKVTLDLSFKNTGSQPIIVYREDLWLGGNFLARSVEDARANKFIYDSSAWRANWGSKMQNELRKKLNKPTPPADLTLILQPGESWQREEVTYLGINKKEEPDTRGRPWDEIRTSSPVWLFIMFEMWPLNAEPKRDPDDPEFGRMLRRRWKNSGELWLAYLTSQPIELDLSPFKEAQ